MAGQGYLSIGDVLSLLREEFPDVTISKIRFLESQGLLDPERTPSGYRKFYEKDVQRLRWILVQQRENFLPLKVIKDRLAEAGGLPAPEPFGAPAAMPGFAVATEGEGTGADVGAGQGAVSTTATISETRPRANGSGVGGDDGGDPRPADMSETATEPAWAGAGTRTTATIGAVGSGIAGAGSALAGSAGSTGIAGSAAGMGGVPAEVPGAAWSAPEGSGELGGERDRDAPASGSARPPGRVEGLTLQELSAASGLSSEEIAQLEAFGLVSSERLADDIVYGQDSLKVARLAARFRRYGIEARHLRMYRNATDREAGLFEQVIIPLIKQRNPEARRRSVEATEELSRLGSELRETLLARVLRQLV